MAWEGLEPWQAIIVGVALAPIVMAATNKAALGYWNFLRAPRDIGHFVWSLVLVLGWFVVFYVPLLLGPSGCEEPDPWGAWEYVHYTIAFSAALAVIAAIVKNERRVDWCAHCRQR